MPAVGCQTSPQSWKETLIQLMGRWQYRKHVKSLAMQRPSPDPNPASQVDIQLVKSLALPASCAHQDDDKTGNQSVPRRPKKLSTLDGFQPQRRRAKHFDTPAGKYKRVRRSGRNRMVWRPKKQQTRSVQTQSDQSAVQDMML